jgi:hypothetical protein
MKNIEQVQAFFHSHIKSILNAQTAATWCEDEKIEDEITALETDIAFFEGQRDDDNYYDDSNFNSEYADSYDDAKRLVDDLNKKLGEKWQFDYPFIQSSYANPIHPKDNFLILGWHLTYYIAIESKLIHVKCDAWSDKITVAIDDQWFGRQRTPIPTDFDLFEYIDQQRVLFHLTKPS